VLPANWLAVRIFLDCAGQWNRDINGTPDGISRSELQSQLHLWQVPRKQEADTFRRIRVMEQVAARVFRQRAQQARDRAAAKARSR
jgi:hypothetical protein